MLKTLFVEKFRQKKNLGFEKTRTKQLIIKKFKRFSNILTHGAVLLLFSGHL